MRPMLVQAEDDEGWIVIYTTLDSTFYAYGSTDCRRWDKMNVSIKERPADAAPCQGLGYGTIALQGLSLP